MRFTFVHTADWQIGKPFAGFPADKIPLLREARLDAIGRIASLARSAGAQHILVAGDVYDSPDLPDRDLRQSIERLRREEDLVWHLLPGNHDPAQPGGIWERLIRLGVPKNVHLQLEPRVERIADGVALLPAPLTMRSATADPTAWMDTAATPGAQFRIGLAHGSIQGFGGEDGEAAVPIAPDRARRAGLDYLALGDWHGVTQISDRVWYSGTPEPDRFPDNEPGFALVVRIGGQNGKVEVERHPTAHYAWRKRSLAVTGSETLASIERDIATDVALPERLLLKLTLKGAVSLSTWSDVTAWLKTLEQRLFHLSVDNQALQVVPEAVELDEFGTGDLRRVAEVLSAAARDEASGKAEVASLALRKLYGLWHEAREGARS